MRKKIQSALDAGLWMRIKDTVYLVETGIEPVVGRHVLVMDNESIRAHVRPYSTEIPGWSVIGCVTSVARMMNEAI